MKIIVFFSIVAVLSCSSSKVSKVSDHPKYQLQISSDTLTKDTLFQFTARPHMGFNFDYLIYLPKGLSFKNVNYLMVETNNSGTNDSIDHHEKGARYAASRSSVGNYIARKLKLPLLVPIFPRSATNWMYYTHALDRDAFLATDFGIERLDLQLLAMIEDANRQLAQKKLFLKDKFFITGFSASGTFANRFSILHPEKIQATAAGGINAIAILPIAELNGATLNYPIGIADITKITGRKVDLQAFKQLPKMLYMGEKDDNDAVAFGDAYSNEERALVYSLIGKQMFPERWAFIQQVYRQNNVLAEFKTYTHIGHGTDLEINTDLINFFRKHIR